LETLASGRWSCIEESGSDTVARRCAPLVTETRTVRRSGIANRINIHVLGNRTDHFYDGNDARPFGSSR